MKPSEIIFEFIETINPPTKNEEKYITVNNRKTRRPMKVKNKNYYQPWELIHNNMYKKRYGISKVAFDYLPPSERALKQKELTKSPVIVSIWNGFKRIDLLNFANELLDRLEGVAYVNDRQVKQVIAFKDDDCEQEYFKVIVEYFV